MVNPSKKVPDLDCEVQDLLEVVDLKQEMSDLRSSGIPPPLNLTLGGDAIYLGSNSYRVNDAVNHTSVALIYGEAGRGKSVRRVCVCVCVCEATDGSRRQDKFTTLLRIISFTEKIKTRSSKLSARLY